MFLPDLTCCFDAIDTQKVYEQFNTYFKYETGLNTINYVKTMPNCYLFESIIEPVYPKYSTSKYFICSVQLIIIYYPFFKIY